MSSIELEYLECGQIHPAYVLQQFLVTQKEF
jgi:hypothetical protein